MIRTISAREALSLLALLLLSLTAGCTMLAGDGSELPAADAVENRTDSIDAIEATVVSSIDADVTTSTSRIRMVSRPETGAMRATLIGSGPQNGTVVVSNGTALSLYDPSANRVQIVDIENLTSTTGNSMESVVEIFDALDDAADGDRANVSISPLPVVPAGGGSPVAGAQSLSVYGNVSLSYEGVETVDGRDAYVVEMTPRRKNPIIEEATYWFDAEWYYPIKSVGTSNESVLNGTITVEYRNVTVNPDVSDDTFEFDVPENATVADSSDDTSTTAETYDSRESLAGAARRPLPDPDVPDDYRFEEGSLVENGTSESVALRYTNGSESLTVSVRSTAIGGDASPGESVRVDGHDATIASVRTTHTLTLECGDTTYRVTGAEPRGTILDVAESLEC